jgi:hypothetical protein
MGARISNSKVLQLSKSPSLAMPYSTSCSSKESNHFETFSQVSDPFHKLRTASRTCCSDARTCLVESRSRSVSKPSLTDWNSTMICISKARVKNMRPSAKTRAVPVQRLASFHGDGRRHLNTRLMALSGRNLVLVYANGRRKGAK